ncbi:MAG TPA: M23 family metallopeptidase [Aggregatilineaceae bacterium]|nr:M23 family metallopeptidase [Aggregatilineaceae bacterium]
MSRFSNLLRRLRLIALLALLIPITFWLVRTITWRAVFHEKTEQRPAAFVPPVGADAQGIPIYSYAAVDPAVIPALEAANGYVQPDPLAMVVTAVPPVGVYLPVTGSGQFKLPQPTVTPALPPLPTLTPRPTRTPYFLPTFTVSMGIVTPGPETPGADGMIGAAPVGYGATDCAPSGWPVQGVLTQYFRWYHRGIDLGTPLGTPVVATHSALVLFAGWRTDGYGNLIILQSGQFITYYGHLSQFNVRQGDLIGRGSVIGWSGSTGNSSGPHVHYEIRINDSEVDPLTFEQRGYPTC